MKALFFASLIDALERTEVDSKRMEARIWLQDLQLIRVVQFGRGGGRHCLYNGTYTAVDLL